MSFNENIEMDVKLSGPNTVWFYKLLPVIHMAWIQQQSQVMFHEQIMYVRLLINSPFLCAIGK